MAKPNFNKLWMSYPYEDSPCDGPWVNQCAIRMSVALNGEGTITVNRGTYSEPKCSHDHARGAESLAIWLTKKIGKPKIYTGAAHAKKDVASKTGIIFFKDCFTRAGETTRMGDHIDLWVQGYTMGYDDPNNKSAQVWFWELF